MDWMQFVFSSFWIWLGCLIMIMAPLSLLVQLLFRCWNRFLRHLSVRKAGWPPSHLDADGDWKPERTD